MLERLAKRITASYKPLLALSAIIVVALAGLAVVGIKGMEPRYQITSGTDSDLVYDQLRDLSQTSSNVVAVVQSPPTDQRAIDTSREAVTRVEKIDGVRTVINYVDAPVPSLLATDQSSFMVAVIMDGSLDDVTLGEASMAVAEQLRRINGGNVEVTGTALITPESGELVSTGALRTIAIAVPVIVLLLGWWFRGLLTAAASLIATVVGLVATVASFAAWERILPIAEHSLSIGALLNVALGVCFGFLFTMRFRAALSAGFRRSEAMIATMQTAGRSILQAGFIAAAAMCALFFFDSPVMRSFAAVGISASILSALVFVTLLPMLFTALGSKVRWQLTREARPVAMRLGRLIQRRPGLLALSTLALLGVLAYPVTSLHPGVTDIKMLPTGSGLRPGAEIIGEKYPDLTIVAVDVVVAAKADDPIIEQVTADLEVIPGVESVEPALVFVPTEKPITNIQAHLRTDSNSQAALGTVRSIQQLGDKYPLIVGGQAAELENAQSMLGDGLPLGVGWLFLATVVGFALISRSLVIPLVVAVTQALTYCIGVGLTARIFQDGTAASLFGVKSVPGYVEVLVPATASIFAVATTVIFSVFLVNHMAETHDQGANPRTAAATGAQFAVRHFTVIASLLSFVFVLLASTPFITLKMTAVSVWFVIAFGAVLGQVFAIPAWCAWLGDAAWATRPRTGRIESSSSYGPAITT